jgi:pimeloyl-ACP methyl ester carboxylesterase
MTLTAILIVAAIFGAFAVTTAIGTLWIERAHPAAGRFVDVTGGRLHVVELGPEERRADALAVVLIHGASGNAEDMRLALGPHLAARWRVILIDRPGLGWSDRPGGNADASPLRQAAYVREALDRLGVKRAIFVAHSWAGALATAFAIEHPAQVAGLVLLAPVSHPWPGGIAWHYRAATLPVIGPVFARMLAVPLGWPLIEGGASSVFAPQPVPPGYVRAAAIGLVLRPPTFLANARDVAELKGNIAVQAVRYGEIRAPTVIITGDSDATVSPNVHSRALSAAIPGAQLVVLEGVGHMPHFAAPDRVVAAVAEIAEAAGSPN